MVRGLKRVLRIYILCIHRLGLDCLKRGRALRVVPEPSRWKRTDHAMSRPVVTVYSARVDFGGVSWAFKFVLWQLLL